MERFCDSCQTTDKDGLKDNGRHHCKTCGKLLRRKCKLCDNVFSISNRTHYSSCSQQKNDPLKLATSEMKVEKKKKRKRSATFDTDMKRICTNCCKTQEDGLKDDGKHHCKDCGTLLYRKCLNCTKLFSISNRNHYSVCTKDTIVEKAEEDEILLLPKMDEENSWTEVILSITIPVRANSVNLEIPYLTLPCMSFYPCNKANLRGMTKFTESFYQLAPINVQEHKYCLANVRKHL